MKVQNSTSTLRKNKSQATFQPQKSQDKMIKGKCQQKINDLKEMKQYQIIDSKSSIFSSTNSSYSNQQYKDDIENVLSQQQYQLDIFSSNATTLVQIDLSSDEEENLVKESLQYKVPDKNNKAKQQQKDQIQRQNPKLPKQKSITSNNKEGKKLRNIKDGNISNHKESFNNSIQQEIHNILSELDINMSKINFKQFKRQRVGQIQNKQQIQLEQKSQNLNSYKEVYEKNQIILVDNKYKLNISQTIVNERIKRFINKGLYLGWKTRKSMNTQVVKDLIMKIKNIQKEIQYLSVNKQQKLQNLKALKQQLIEIVNMEGNQNLRQSNSIQNYELNNIVNISTLNINHQQKAEQQEHLNTVEVSEKYNHINDFLFNFEDHQNTEFQCSILQNNHDTISKNEFQTFNEKLNPSQQETILINDKFQEISFNNDDFQLIDIVYKDLTKIKNCFDEYFSKSSQCSKKTGDNGGIFEYSTYYADTRKCSFALPDVEQYKQNLISKRNEYLNGQLKDSIEVGNFNYTPLFINHRSYTNLQEQKQSKSLERISTLSQGELIENKRLKQLRKQYCKSSITKRRNSLQFTSSTSYMSSKRNSQLTCHIPSIKQQIQIDNCKNLSNKEDAIQKKEQVFKEMGHFFNILDKQDCINEQQQSALISELDLILERVKNICKDMMINRS